jgi:hypothetical protein
VARTEREAELVDTFRAIQAEGLPHVLVGGWAVSAFQARFTIDIDVVVPSDALDDYEAVLTDRGYSRVLDQDVSNVYEGRMVGYEADVGGNTVGFEAMADALRCRQTDAEWSYRYLEKHSTIRDLEMAPEIEARIPDPALLFAIKLHSGRTADTRDLVVIASEADLDQVDRHLHRGDKERLAKRIEQVLDRMTDENFEDSFKGVFQQASLPEPDVDRVVTHLRSVTDEI